MFKRLGAKLDKLSTIKVLLCYTIPMTLLLLSLLLPDFWYVALMGKADTEIIAQTLVDYEEATESYTGIFSQSKLVRSFLDFAIKNPVSMGSKPAIDYKSGLFVEGGRLVQTLQRVSDVISENEEELKKNPVYFESMMGGILKDYDGLNYLSYSAAMSVLESYNKNDSVANYYSDSLKTMLKYRSIMLLIYYGLPCLVFIILLMKSPSPLLTRLVRAAVNKMVNKVERRRAS